MCVNLDLLLLFGIQTEESKTKLAVLKPLSSLGDVACVHSFSSSRLRVYSHAS